MLASLRKRLRPEERESGFTLVELLVAMGIFMVFLSVMMAGVVALTANLRKTNNLNDANDESRRVFQALDKQLRYATGVDEPDLTSAGANQYLEFTTFDINGTEICRQWRLVGATNQLQQRMWTAAAAPVSGPSWTTVAVSVVNDPSADPVFSFVPVSTTSERAGITLDLKVAKGKQRSATSRTTTTFFARNTNIDSDSDASVCHTSWYRS